MQRRRKAPFDVPPDAVTNASRYCGDEKKDDSSSHLNNLVIESNVNFCYSRRALISSCSRVWSGNIEREENWVDIFKGEDGLTLVLSGFPIKMSRC